MSLDLFKLCIKFIFAINKSTNQQDFGHWNVDMGGQV